MAWTDVARTTAPLRRRVAGSAVLAALAAVLSAGVTTLAPLPGRAAGWVPSQGTTWQIQYAGRLDQSIAAAVYDVDMVDTSAATVAALHARGRHVLCYVDAGTWESWRPDASAYPAVVLGAPVAGWPGERWLDVRRLDVLGPILAARLDRCRARGFDGVDPDNVDGYTNITGFPLTGAQQITFNRWVASAAHARGLAVGLKNDVGQVAALQPQFDFSVDEQCFQYQECGTLLPFLRAGKAVLEIEYDPAQMAHCAAANAARMSTLLKRRNLDATRVACASV